MFIKERVDILEVLKKVQRKHCCYDLFGYMTEPTEPPPVCDCKYGYTGKHERGEATGCPELRCVVEILTLMTDDEYSKIMAKGKHIL